MSEVLSKIEELITPLLNQENIELVDLTYQKGPSGWILAVYLDKAGGITLDDCSKWNDHIGELLDGVDIFNHAYSLEVSSPGLDRPLKKMADFQRFKGQRINVKLFAALNGQKNFHGLLLDATPEAVVLKEEGKEPVSLPHKQIARARLDPVFDF